MLVNIFGLWGRVIVIAEYGGIQRRAQRSITGVFTFLSPLSMIKALEQTLCRVPAL